MAETPYNATLGETALECRVLQPERETCVNGKRVFGFAENTGGTTENFASSRRTVVFQDGVYFFGGKL